MSAIRRVLQVHTRYRQAGGEDQLVAAEQRLLEAGGIEVRQVLFDNAELRESRSIGGDLRLAREAIWSSSAMDRVRSEVRAFRPDVMHVHNTFAAASPSVHAAAARLHIPVVQTLHNYRLVCPAATAWRDGHACTDCVGLPVPLPGIAHACVRGSRAQSAVVASLLVTHRLARTWRRDVAQHLALTEFQRRLLLRGGLPPARVRVLPNFVEPDPGVGEGRRTGVLFVGRLAPDKGIASLLDAARRRSGLIRIAGAGPLESVVRGAADGGLVDHLGFLDGEAVRHQMQAATAAVVPSTCFEGFPMVVAEAFACGTPVIASRIGSLSEIVEDGVTGLLVPPGDGGALAERLAWAVEHPTEMAALGQAARARYERDFSGRAHLPALLDTYEAAQAWVRDRSRRAHA